MFFVVSGINVAIISLESLIIPTFSVRETGISSVRNLILSYPIWRFKAKKAVDPRGQTAS